MCTFFFTSDWVSPTPTPPPRQEKNIQNYKMHVYHDCLQLKPLHNISNNKQVVAKTNLSCSKRHLAMVISVECGKLLQKVIQLIWQTSLASTQLVLRRKSLISKVIPSGLWNSNLVEALIVFTLYFCWNLNKVNRHYTRPNCGTYWAKRWGVVESVFPAISGLWITQAKFTLSDNCPVPYIRKNCSTFAARQTYWSSTQTPTFQLVRNKNNASFLSTNLCFDQIHFIYQ